MSILKTALVATVMVLITVFVLNQISFTAGIVQAALRPKAA